MNTPAVVIDTAPLLDVAALKVILSALGSAAVTVPVTAAVVEFGALTTTLVITGGLLTAVVVTVAAGTAVPAATVPT